MNNKTLYYRKALFTAVYFCNGPLCLHREGQQKNKEENSLQAYGLNGNVRSIFITEGEAKSKFGEITMSKETDKCTQIKFDSNGNWTKRITYKGEERIPIKIATREITYW